MDVSDRLGTLRFLIHDRDPLFTTAFGEVFKAEGLRIILTQYVAYFDGRRPHRSGQLHPPRPDHPTGLPLSMRSARVSA